MDMDDMIDITYFPSRLRLAAALLPEGHEPHERVEFILADGSKVLCIVTNINTIGGQLIVSGSYVGEDGRLAGFYEADFTSKGFRFK